MSTPDPNKIKEAPDLPAEFESLLKGHQEWQISRLVTKEEWKEMCKHDDCLLQILDYIQRDRAVKMEVKKELSEVLRTARGIRSRILKIDHRIAGRQRQYRYFAKLLHKKMAWAKIKQMRKEIGLD